MVAWKFKRREKVTTILAFLIQGSEINSRGRFTHFICKIYAIYVDTAFYYGNKKYKELKQKI